jgi:methyltransferase (TIGR00027 family)
VRVYNRWTEDLLSGTQEGRMDPSRASETAVDAAHVRALDSELLQPPVLDDRLAARLLQPAERDARETQVIGEVLARSPEMAGEHRADLLRIALRRNANSVSLVLGRARYAEAALLDAMERGVRQYVLVGAGLDTFALRRRDLCERLDVFEIDHPQSQTDKLERLERAGLEAPANLHFGACDFETEGVQTALSGLPYDADAPAFFACLGVTMYLTRPALDATLRSLRVAAPAGSELVFDYLEAGAMQAHGSRDSIRSNLERVQEMGEPVVGQLAADTLAGELRWLGLELVESLGRGELQRLYFRNRKDGLTASEIGQIARFRMV